MKYDFQEFFGPKQKPYYIAALTNQAETIFLPFKQHFEIQPNVNTPSVRVPDIYHDLTTFQLSRSSIMYNLDNFFFDERHGFHNYTFVAGAIEVSFLINRSYSISISKCFFILEITYQDCEKYFIIS